MIGPSIYIQQSIPTGNPELPIAYQVALPGNFEWLAFYPGRCLLNGSLTNDFVVRLYQQTGGIANSWNAAGTYRTGTPVICLTTNSGQGAIPWQADLNFLIEVTATNPIVASQPTSVELSFVPWSSGGYHG